MRGLSDTGHRSVAARSCMRIRTVKKVFTVSSAVATPQNKTPNHLIEVLSQRKAVAVRASRAAALPRRITPSFPVSEDCSVKIPGGNGLPFAATRAAARPQNKTPPCPVRVIQYKAPGGDLLQPSRYARLAAAARPKRKTPTVSGEGYSV